MDANEANKSISKTDSNAKQLGSRLASSIKTAAKWGAALVGAASAVTVAVVKATKATAEHGDEIDKNSQKLQVSAEQYQKLAFAAERCGTSITTIATANKTLQSSNFTGNMYDAVKAVAAIQDPAERAAKATELFGKKAGQEMLPLLNNGADGVEALFNEVEALGGIMSDKAVKAAAEYKDSLTNLQTAWGGFKYRLTADFMPGITDAMNGFAEMLAGKTDEGAENLRNGAQEILTAFGDALTALKPIVSNIWETIFNTLFSEERIERMVEGAGELILGLVGGLLGASEEKKNKTKAEIAGENIANGVAEGFKQIIQNFDWWGFIWGVIKNGATTNTMSELLGTGNASKMTGGMGTAGYHASGLTYVPYDGYTATLHRGERVVSAGQNERYSDNSDVITAIEALGNRIAAMQMVVDGETVIGYVDNGLGRRATSAGRLSMA